MRQDNMESTLLHSHGNQTDILKVSFIRWDDLPFRSLVLFHILKFYSCILHYLWVI